MNTLLRKSRNLGKELCFGTQLRIWGKYDIFLFLSGHRTEQLQLILMSTYMHLFSLTAFFHLFLSPSLSTLGYMLTTLQNSTAFQLKANKKRCSFFPLNPWSPKVPGPIYVNK